jgi:hypothetical protein
MANSWYNVALDNFAKKQIDWINDTIKAVLIDSGAYTFAATHADLTSIPTGSRIGTPQTLAGKTVSGGGILDANDITFPAVAQTNPTVEAVLVYAEGGGTDATRTPLLYLDTFDVGALSVQPNGGDIAITWDNGTNKIAKL